MAVKSSEFQTETLPKKLLAQCKCGVFLTINEHRDYYKTAEQALEELASMEVTPDIDADVRKTMIDTDTIVSLQFYPDTPIGSYSIYHYDVDAVIQRALRCLDYLTAARKTAVASSRNAEPHT